MINVSINDGPFDGFCPATIPRRSTRKCRSFRLAGATSGSKEFTASFHLFEIVNTNRNIFFRDGSQENNPELFPVFHVWLGFWVEESQVIDLRLWYVKLLKSGSKDHMPPPRDAMVPGDRGGDRCWNGWCREHHSRVRHRMMRIVLLNWIFDGYVRPFKICKIRVLHVIVVSKQDIREAIEKEALTFLNVEMGHFLCLKSYNPGFIDTIRIAIDYEAFYVTAADLSCLQSDWRFPRKSKEFLLANPGLHVPFHFDSDSFSPNFAEGVQPGKFQAFVEEQESEEQRISPSKTSSRISHSEALDRWWWRKSCTKLTG